MEKNSDDHKFTPPRLDNEQKTIEAMITIYCHAHHNSQLQLCQNCDELLHYANKRLMHCPFQERKPTCGKCTVHCYRPEMRELIRKVMRYSGPRMLYHHPLMAFRHLLDGCKQPPESSADKKQGSVQTTPVTGKRRSNT